MQQAWKIVITIIVTAIVVGGGVYWWQIATVPAATSLTVGSFSFDCSDRDTFCELQPGRLVEEIEVMGQLRTPEEEIAQVVYFKDNLEEVEKNIDQKIERKNIGENKIIIVKPLPWVVDYFIYSTTEECRVLHFRGNKDDSQMLDKIAGTIKYTRGCGITP